MNPAVATAHRHRVLHALGLVPWQRRQGDVVTAEPLAGDVAPGTSEVACVVLLPAACGTRELDLLGRALNCAGPALARAPRVRAGADGTLAAPVAHTYLAFGEAQAHALGRSLPASVTAQVQVLLVDEPAQVLCEAAAKRRLWIALRNLRRRLATGET